MVNGSTCLLVQLLACTNEESLTKIRCNHYESRIRMWKHYLHKCSWLWWRCILGWQVFFVIRVFSLKRLHFHWFSNYPWRVLFLLHSAMAGHEDCVEYDGHCWRRDDQDEEDVNFCLQIVQLNDINFSFEVPLCGLYVVWCYLAKAGHSSSVLNLIFLPPHYSCSYTLPSEEASHLCQVVWDIAAPHTMNERCIQISCGFYTSMEIGRPCYPLLSKDFVYLELGCTRINTGRPPELFNNSTFIIWDGTHIIARAPSDRGVRTIDHSLLTPFSSVFIS